MKLIPTLHPSYIQRGSWPELALLRDDLEKALRESAFEEVRRAPTNYKTNPTIEEVRAVLRLGDQRPLIIDIETDVPPTKILCVGVGRGQPGEALCLPWQYQYIQLLRSALLDASSIKVGHNLLAFDIPQLEKHLDIKVAGA